MIYLYPLRLFQIAGIFPLEFNNDGIHFSTKWLKWSRIVAIFCTYKMIRLLYLNLSNDLKLYSGSFTYQRLADVENYFLAAIVLIIIWTNCYHKNVSKQKKFINILFFQFETTRKESQTKGIKFLFYTLTGGIIYVILNFIFFNFVFHKLDTTLQAEGYEIELMQTVLICLVADKFCLCQKIIRDEVFLLEKNLIEQNLSTKNFERFLKKYNLIMGALHAFEKLHRPAIFILFVTFFVDLVCAIKGLENIIWFVAEKKFDTEILNVIITILWFIICMPLSLWCVIMGDQIHRKVKSKIFFNLKAAIGFLYLTASSFLEFG